MGKDISSSSSNRSIGSVELWITPLIGLILLGGLIYHWRLQLVEVAGAASTNDWRTQLKANIGLEIALGVVPLFVAACLQRLLRSWKWYGWVQGLTVGLIGALVVGVFYYYALYPLSHWFKPYNEGEGNVMAIFMGNIFGLSVIGGFSVFMSFIITSVLIQRQRKSLVM